MTAEDKSLDVGRGRCSSTPSCADAKRNTLSDRTVVWTSSDPTIAQVVTIGALDNWAGAGQEIAQGAAFARVTGAGAGSVTITANSEGQGRLKCA